MLKAGGAYLPLDAGSPDERLAWMLADAGAAVAIVAGGARRRLGGWAGRLLCIDEEAAAIAAEPASAPRVAVSPAGAAYVIYTSGSSGSPKGVVATHAGVCNYVLWSAAAYEVQAHGGASLHTPLAFDLTVAALLTPLLAGRPVALIP